MSCSLITGHRWERNMNGTASCICGEELSVEQATQAFGKSNPSRIETITLNRHDISSLWRLSLDQVRRAKKSKAKHPWDPSRGAIDHNEVRIAKWERLARLLEEKCQ